MKKKEEKKEKRIEENWKQNENKLKISIKECGKSRQRAGE